MQFYIANVQKIKGLGEGLDGVGYVFRTAALKQVSSREFHPMEAVRANVMDMDKSLTSALECGVKNGVVLRTDKAAYLISAKRVDNHLRNPVPHHISAPTKVQRYQ